MTTKHQEQGIRQQQHAFIGIGNMGREIAKNLVQVGQLEKPMILFNRTAAKAFDSAKLIGHCVVNESLLEAVDSAEVVWLCLLNPAAVLDVFRDISTHDVRGKLFIDCSTVHPDTTRAVAEVLHDAGASFVAMPVFGEPTMAATGALVCVPAGEGSLIARIEPLLVGVIARGLIDLRDEPPEKASLLKMLGNVIILTTMQTVAEINVFAETSGLGLGPMQHLIKTLFPRPPHTIYTDRMVSGKYILDTPMVEVHKAISLANDVLGLAQKSGTSLESYKLAVKRLEESQSLAGPASDITGMYGAIRVASNLSYKNI